MRRMCRRMCPGAVFVWWMLVPACAVAAKAEVRATDFFRPESATCGIQEAISALPPEGGTVYIPPGTYRLRCALVLRSHVTLRGAGPTTILTRGKQLSAKLTRPARKGQTSIEVESTAGFQVGDEVALIADGMGGWYMPHGLLKQIGPTRLESAEPLDCGHPEGLFSPEKHATAVNYFPFVCAGRQHSGKPVVGIAVFDLTIDGNLKENPGPWSDFTLAAIHLAGVSDSLVRNVSVRGSIGDGIGVQGGSDNRIETCLVEHCRGHGYHPGTSLRGAVFANNIGRHNNADGLYFCCDVVGISVTGNLLHDNRGSGIGGLGEGCGTSDRFNVVANNICRHNGLWGIQAVGGRNNVITGNVCLDNSQSQPGRYSGICLIDTTQTTVTSNHCSSDQQKPTQKLGIEESGQSNHNVITGNLCGGNVEGGIAVVGAETQVFANVGGFAKAAK